MVVTSFLPLVLILLMKEGEQPLGALASAILQKSKANIAMTLGKDSKVLRILGAIFT